MATTARAIVFTANRVRKALATAEKNLLTQAEKLEREGRGEEFNLFVPGDRQTIERSLLYRLEKVLEHESSTYRDRYIKRMRLRRRSRAFRHTSEKT